MNVLTFPTRAAPSSPKAMEEALEYLRLCQSAALSLLKSNDFGEAFAQCVDAFQYQPPAGVDLREFRRERAHLFAAFAGGAQWSLHTYAGYFPEHESL